MTMFDGLQQTELGDIQLLLPVNKTNKPKTCNKNKYFTIFQKF